MLNKISYAKKVILKSKFPVNNKFFSTNTDVSTELKDSPVNKFEHLNNLHPDDYYLQEIRDNLEHNLRYFSQKGIKQGFENPEHIKIIAESFKTSQSSLVIIEFIKSYQGILETRDIFEKFRLIAEQNDVSKELFTEVIPVLKSYMIKFERNSIAELYNAGMGAAQLHIADLEFWQIFEQKLVGEKLYRYLSVEQVVDLAVCLRINERASSVLLKILEVEIIKHRRALHFPQRKALLTKAKACFVEGTTEGVGKSENDVLIAALNDPNIEVELPKLV